MRKNFIKVFSKEQCLAIAKIANPDSEGWSDDELLHYLPDNIFGNEMVYTNLNNYFTVFDGQYEWCVPTYFVDYAPVLII